MENAFGVSDLADGDGDSDGADFLIMQRYFGSSVPIVTSNVAVPEPATGILLILGMTAPLFRRIGF